MLPKSEITLLDILYLLGITKEETGKTTSSGFDKLIDNPEYGIEFFSKFFDIEDQHIIGNEVAEALDAYLEDYGYKSASLDGMIDLYEKDEITKDLGYRLLKDGFKYYAEYNENYIISRIQFTDEFESLEYLFAQQPESSNLPQNKSPRKITPGREVDLTQYKRSGANKRGKSSKTARRAVKGETSPKSKKQQQEEPEVRSNRSMGINERKYIMSLSEFLKENV